MEKVEAKNAEKIPKDILYKCTPFEGFKEREFVLRLEIITSDAKPKISFEIMNFSKIKEEIEDEFKEIIKNKFGDKGPKTYIGEIS